MRMILQTVGMLYRYLAVLHRQFPLLRTTIGALLSLPLSYIIGIPLQLVLSRRRPLLLSGAQRLRFTVASRSFVRSFVCLLACSPGIRINSRPVPLSYRTPTCVIDRTELENPDAQIERVATKITLLLHHSSSSYRIHSICRILGFSTCF